MKTRKELNTWVNQIHKEVAKPLGFCNIPWYDNDHNSDECPNCNISRKNWEKWRDFWKNFKK